VALHFGEVAYGNVGSGMRLDYTVIGRDVNLAARVAALCGSEGEPLLLSAAFRDHAGVRGRAVGERSMKGIKEPQQVFAVTL
jgi:adenylate cyclase